MIVVLLFCCLGIIAVESNTIDCCKSNLTKSNIEECDTANIMRNHENLTKEIYNYLKKEKNSLENQLESYKNYSNNMETTLKEANAKIIELYGEKQNETNKDMLFLKACYGGEYTIISAFLNLGGLNVDKYLISEEKLTCLHVASTWNYVKLAKLLIKNGANINAKTSSKITPSIFAAERGQLDVLKILVNEAADLTMRSDYNGTALEIAKINKKTKVVEYLTSESKKNFVKAYGQNKNLTNNIDIMWHGCRFGEIDIVMSLLDLGLDEDAIVSNQYQRTCLHYAAIYNYTNLAIQLIERGANIDAMSSEKYTPAIYAASIGNLEILKILVEIGADLTLRDNRNRNALGEARISKKENVIIYLLSEGAPE